MRMGRAETLKSILRADRESFFLIAGPCVIESRDLIFEVAEHLLEITSTLEIPFIFKSSYKKANRSSADSFTGIGDEKALKALAEVRDQLDVPVITDVHSPAEAVMAAEYADVLQIPAFLCRQTELLQAAAGTGRIINVKKGQFLSPEAMRFAAEKILCSGNSDIMLTERGVTFGYHELLVDMRSIAIMKALGYPVVLDCTHANQQPNQPAGKTGGRPEFVELLARSGIAAGADGLFIETHPTPQEALSDAANMLPLSDMESLLRVCKRIFAALQEQ